MMPPGLARADNPAPAIRGLRRSYGWVAGGVVGGRSGASRDTRTALLRTFEAAKQGHAGSIRLAAPPEAAAPL